MDSSLGRDFLTWDCFSFYLSEDIHVVRYKFINPIYESICNGNKFLNHSYWVMWPFPLLHCPCPYDSKNVWHLYVSLIWKKFINTIYWWWVKLPPSINPIFGKKGRPQPNNAKKVWHLYVSLMLFEISLIYGCEVKYMLKSLG